MSYDSLQDLIRRSASSRSFFLSLPVSLQLQLHEQAFYIHSASDLHSRAELVQKHNHAVEISESFRPFS